MHFQNQQGETVRYLAALRIGQSGVASESQSLTKSKTKTTKTKTTNDNNNNNNNKINKFHITISVLFTIIAALVVRVGQGSGIRGLWTTTAPIRVPRVG